MSSTNPSAAPQARGRFFDKFKRGSPSTPRTTERSPRFLDRFKRTPRSTETSPAVERTEPQVQKPIDNVDVDSTEPQVQHMSIHSDEAAPPLPVFIGTTSEEYTTSDGESSDDESTVGITAAARSKALVLYDSAKARVHVTVAPHYVHVRDGIVSIVTVVGDRVVMFQTKASEIYTGAHARVLNSATGAWHVIDGYTSPLVSRIASSQNRIAGHAEHYTVRIKDGVFSVKGAAGEHIVQWQATLSKAVASNGVTKAIADIAGKVAAFVSDSYGQTVDATTLLCSNTKDGFVKITCKVHDRVIVFKVKVAELQEFLQMKAMQISSTTLAALTDKYSGVRSSLLHATHNAKVKSIEVGTTVLQLTESAKAKSIEVGTNVKSIATTPRGKVTTASAASGAVALGASGGAAGLMAGSAMGAALGVPAAFFTLGLSIPLGAAVGGGAGLCVGTVAGGTTGLVAGGAVGYGAHAQKDNIGSGLNSARTKAKLYTDIAAASTNKLRARVTGGSD